MILILIYLLTAENFYNLLTMYMNIKLDLLEFHPKAATLAPPKGRLPFDLHVLGLPLAFILSQDQTLRCTIAFLKFCSESRVPLSFSCVPFPVSASRLTDGCGPFPCAGLKLSKNFALPFSLQINPSFLWERIAKVRPFWKLAIKKFNYFL